MTTFPPLPGSGGHLSERRNPRSERYSFQVVGKDYTIQYLRMSYLEGYDDAQLAWLAVSSAIEVSFRLDDYTLPDGAILGGYHTTNTGSAFQILGGVANGILAWAQEHRPEYLYWYAQGTRRQQVFDRIIRVFAHRGSGWQRLPISPFTRVPCPPGEFWLGHTLDGQEYGRP